MSPSPLLRDFDFSQYNILVIDDHDDSLFLLIEIFKHCRANVFGARDTDEARDVMTKVWPDVIVTDINLPRETGIEFAEWVRTHYPDKASKTLIIAITATSPVIAIDAPPVIDAEVRKPIEIEDVCDLVENLLRRRRGDVR